MGRSVCLYRCRAADGAVRVPFAARRFGVHRAGVGLQRSGARASTCTRDRRRHLVAANLGVEKLRFLCRLAKDLGHLDVRRYEHAARALDETGRLIGGWRKAHEAAQG